MTILQSQLSISIDHALPLLALLGLLFEIIIRLCQEKNRVKNVYKELDRTPTINYLQTSQSVLIRQHHPFP
jgi:hypothetical protein